ncbi:MAG TPA: hypothetical protein VLA19_28945 [Herpetosiphonaceae bacterium]|nr:hypothetical protein [Herpetosiphonaceae bacterium]
MLKAPRSHVLLFIASTSFLALPLVRDVKAQPAQAVPSGIVRDAAGWMHLSAMAEPAPRAMGAFSRWGMWDSPPLKLQQSFEAARVRYRDQLPVGTRRFVAVRAGADGRHWSEWEWDVSDGRVVMFDGEQRWIQHRVVLLGSAGRSPAVSAITIVPEAARTAKQAAGRTAELLAPTYRLRVTRQGMAGRRTANGYVIKPNDFFVSLPSWSVLSSRDGSEYMVRLSANGKSVDVRVADVGPWNRQDNFWDTDRARYTDLPAGWPQDHAAFYENHNGRRADKGWVRYPSAVDVADGAYRALGLRGSQATVNVTLLWLGKDPGPNPQPLNDHPSQRPKPPVYVEPALPGAVETPMGETPPVPAGIMEPPAHDDVTLAPTEP